MSSESPKTEVKDDQAKLLRWVQRLNTWQRWGAGLLLIYAGFILLQLARVLIIGVPWVNLGDWPLQASPLGIIGAGLLIAGSIKTANNYLTTSLVCFWIYALTRPVSVISDYSRPPPCCFDAYGLEIFAFMLLTIPLAGLASIFWFVGYLNTDLPRGKQLFWQLLQAGGLGLGFGLALPVIWGIWELLSDNLATEKDWWGQIVFIVLALAVATLASWLIRRIKLPDKS